MFNDHDVTFVTFHAGTRYNFCRPLKRADVSLHNIRVHAATKCVLFQFFQATKELFYNMRRRPNNNI